MIDSAEVLQAHHGDGECYQVNGSVKALYSESEAKLVSLSVNDILVADDQQYKITLQSYHIANSKANLNISNEELMALNVSKVETTSAHQFLEEWLRGHPNVTRKIEGRIVFKTSRYG